MKKAVSDFSGSNVDFPLEDSFGERKGVAQNGQRGRLFRMNYPPGNLKYGFLKMGRHKKEQFDFILFKIAV